MSHKRLFSRALAAHEAAGRLHFAAHSHHLWPDAARDGQIACWDDGATLADRKWDKVMGEIWPAAQRAVSAELGLPSADSIVFASNTHDLLIRLLSARAERPVRILASDGEFHSFRRQAARWIESGRITLDTVPNEPFDDFDARFLKAAQGGSHDLVFISHVFFGSGRIFEAAAELAALASPAGRWVVIDGYHGFCAIETDLSPIADRVFYLAGGYKYAMAGEGMGFMHCPPGYGSRPEITGWYAEFDDLSAPPGGVGYAPDARRFLGATFDPSALYRFTAIREMLTAEKLTTATMAAHVHALQRGLIERLRGTPLDNAELLNPPGDAPAARFLAFRTNDAQALTEALHATGVTVDARGNVLRIGIGLYHDMDDIERLAEKLRSLG